MLTVIVRILETVVTKTVCGQVTCEWLYASIFEYGCKNIPQVTRRTLSVIFQASFFCNYTVLYYFCSLFRSQLSQSSLRRIAISWQLISIEKAVLCDYLRNEPGFWTILKLYMLEHIIGKVIIDKNWKNLQALGHEKKEVKFNISYSISITNRHFTFISIFWK